MPYDSIEKRRAHMAAYVKRPEVAVRRKIAMKQWTLDHRDVLRQREAVRQLTQRGEGMVSHARIRAARKQVPFNLNTADIQARIDAGHCEMTGVVFNMTPGGPHWNSPSIDRIKPALGYVASNVRIICHAMNCAMNRWGEEAIREMLIGYAKPACNDVTAPHL